MRVFGGIRQQVHRNLTDSHAVAEKLIRDMRVDVHFEFKVFLFDAGLNHVDKILDNFGKRVIFLNQFHFAALNFAEV